MYNKIWKIGIIIVVLGIIGECYYFIYGSKPIYNLTDDDKELAVYNILVSKTTNTIIGETIELTDRGVNNLYVVKYIEIIDSNKYKVTRQIVKIDDSLNVSGLIVINYWVNEK